MHFASVLPVLLLSGLTQAAPQVTSTLPVADAFTLPAIVSTSFAGSGCPQGTTDVSVTDPWKNFAFDLPRFKVKTGPSTAIAERSVNCQAHVNFGGTATGWQFALKDHWSRGHFEVSGPGVTLTQYLTVYFSQNAADTATTVRSVPSTNMTISKNLDLYSSIPEDAMIWSPCGGAGLLNINFRMAFTGVTQNVTAFYGAGTRRPVSESWTWAWRRC